MATATVVVLDLDGTLLRSDQTISPAGAAVLRDLSGRGVTLVTATARPRRAVWGLIPAALLDSWVILYNGSQIWRHRRLIRQEQLSRAVLAAIVRGVVREFPQSAVGFEHGDRLYVNRHFDRHWPPHMERVVDLGQSPSTGALKILIDLVEPRMEPWLRARLPAGCQLLVTDGGTLAQILPAAAGKVRAVRFILRRLGKTMSDVLCFGDDHNDAELLEACPNSVAMANAPEAIRRAASRQTRSNDEDGVAWYLKAYFRL